MVRVIIVSLVLMVALCACSREEQVLEKGEYMLTIYGQGNREIKHFVGVSYREAYRCLDKTMRTWNPYTHYKPGWRISRLPEEVLRTLDTGNSTGGAK